MSNSFWEGIKQVIALIFVNLVPFLLSPQFLTVAISIDSLVLGVSLQSIMNKKTEERLDITLQEMISLAKLSAQILVEHASSKSSSQQKVVV